MGKLDTLEQIREQVRQKLMLENLAMQSNGDQSPLENALRVVPEAKMWDSIQWLHEVLLPGIEKAKGKDSENYKKLAAVRDSIIWALYTMNKCEAREVNAMNERFLISVYRDRMLFYQKELEKYQTAEQMVTTETLDAYRNAVVARAVKLLDEKQKSKIK